MYHLAFLLEKISPKESLKYYKLSAELGYPRSRSIYAISIEKNNPNLALKFYIKAAKGGNINAQEFLVFKYAKENDTENTLKYIHLLINEGRFDIPLKYAVSLYKSKNFKQAWYIFSILEKINHPIAMYFIGVMLYRGEGCDKNKNEAQKILEKLSNSGINEASEFLENYEF